MKKAADLIFRFMRALILQMRGKGDSSREVEQKEYLAYTGLNSTQVNFVDLYDRPDFDPDQLLKHDILFIGGISKDKATELEWPEHRFPFYPQHKSHNVFGY